MSLAIAYNGGIHVDSSGIYNGNTITEFVTIKKHFLSPDKKIALVYVGVETDTESTAFQDLIKAFRSGYRFWLKTTVLDRSDRFPITILTSDSDNSSLFDSGFIMTKEHTFIMEHGVGLTLIEGGRTFTVRLIEPNEFEALGTGFLIAASFHGLGRSISELYEMANIYCDSMYPSEVISYFQKDLKPFTTIRKSRQKT